MSVDIGRNGEKWIHMWADALREVAKWPFLHTSALSHAALGENVGHETLFRVDPRHGARPFMVVEITRRII